MACGKKIERNNSASAAAAAHPRASATRFRRIALSVTRPDLIRALAIERQCGRSARTLQTLTIVSVLLFSRITPAVPAFPGAEGFGSQTPGGRGGRVIAVTNLNDEGPGSLRAALEALGARTVVFRTGGTIVLQRTLEIANPYITVAGQTAPGGGIQLRNDPYGSATYDSFPTLRITTHDVVIRYLRVRPGSLVYDASCATVPRRGTEQRCVPSNDIDSIMIDENAERVVIDHVSAAWATDELVDVTWARDVSIQWSILAEALKYTHYDLEDPGQGKGMCFGTKSHAKQGRYVQRVSVHHNLFASNFIRNPQASSACADPDDPELCLTDVRQNVVYNWGKMGTLAVNVNGHNFVNVVDNIYKAGPDSSRPQALGILDWTRTSSVPGAGTLVRPFFDSNLMLGELGASTPIEVFCSMMGRTPRGRNRVVGHCRSEELMASSAYDAPPVTTLPPEAVYASVLALAGANIRRDKEGRTIPNRDAADLRVVSEAQTGEGRIIYGPDVFPGWPDLPTGRPAADNDGDGMPNAWERRHGFDSDVAAHPTADADGDGYTDLEEYLNETDPHAPE